MVNNAVAQWVYSCAYVVFDHHIIFELTSYQVFIINIINRRFHHITGDRLNKSRGHRYINTTRSAYLHLIFFGRTGQCSHS